MATSMLYNTALRGTILSIAFLLASLPVPGEAKSAGAGLRVVAQRAVLLPGNIIPVSYSRGNRTLYVSSTVLGVGEILTLSD